jgi:hypothetical protein
MSINKSLIIALISWGIYGLFYFLYLFKVDLIILGVFKELLVIPSFLVGSVFTVVSIFKTIKNPLD